MLADDLRGWRQRVVQPNFSVNGVEVLGRGRRPCEPVVRAAVAGVDDWVYEGYGNWPFNVAYAATQGLEGYVVCFTTLRQVEEWITARVPVIASIAWSTGD